MLGVGNSADKNAIEEAFRKKSLKIFEFTSDSPLFDEAIKKMNAARACLSNP